MANFYKSSDATVAAHGAVVIVPTDTAATVIPITRSIYVGVGGNITVVMADAATTATTVLFVGVPSGTTLPIQITRVAATGTTATSLLALY